jgi:hypothetical protein
LTTTFKAERKNYQDCGPWWWSQCFDRQAASFVLQDDLSLNVQRVLVELGLIGKDQQIVHVKVENKLFHKNCY